MANIPNVHIRQLSIVLGGVSIIAGLDLQVAPGEFIVLLGPSGCGKSTLLHSIAGLIDVHDGAIEIGSRDVTWADPKDRGIGMVFQSYALYPTMTVAQNMSFGLRISGAPKAEIARRVQRAAQMLQLTELLGRKPAQLSGGQRQRVAIGRALVRDAGVYLFDEPLSNLDAKLRAELRRELKELHAQLGATMIYVTHDQVEAMTLATRIVVMRKGQIQQIGTPAQVYQRPVNRFVASFLGAPGMNFIPGRLMVRSHPLAGQSSPSAEQVLFEGESLALDLSAYPFAQPPQNGQAVVLGLRPEHLAVLPLGEPTPPALAGLAPLGRASLSLAEPLGALDVLWLDAGGLRLGVQVAAQTEPPLGSALQLLADGARASLFDAVSEQRL